MCPDAVMIKKAKIVWDTFLEITEIDTDHCEKQKEILNFFFL